MEKAEIEKQFVMDMKNAGYEIKEEHSIYSSINNFHYRGPLVYTHVASFDKIQSKTNIKLKVSKCANSHCDIFPEILVEYY